MMELKNVKGFENYRIDENGNIYDSDNNAVKTFINPCNYVCVRLNNRICTVAYLMARTWLNNPDMCVCVGYKDNDYSNLNINNLYWYYSAYEEEQEREIIIVDENGEELERYDNIEECAKANNIAETTCDLKCRFGNIYPSDGNRNYFYGDKFNMDKLQKRVEKRTQYIKERNERAATRREELAEKMAEYAKKKPMAKSIIEVNSNGEIVTEYESILQMMSMLEIGYMKVIKILNDTGTYNNNYFIYKSKYNPDTIKFFIEKVDEMNRRKEEAKKQKEKKKYNYYVKKGTRLKPINQYDLEGNLIRRYENTKELKKLNPTIKRTSIYSCLNGHIATAYNYVWRYEGEAFDKYKTPKIKDGKTAKEKHNKWKPIIELNKDGEIIKEYERSTEVTKELEIKTTSVFIVNKRITKRNTVLIYKENYSEELFDKEYKGLFESKNKRGSYGKEIEVYDKNNNLIGKYKGIVAASNALQIQQATISRNINNGRLINDGYYFRRKDY